MAQRWNRAVLVLALASSFTSVNQAATIFTANLTTSQEPGVIIPTTSGGASRPQAFGTATLILNDAMDALTLTATIFNIDFTGDQTPDTNDDLTVAHIHASSDPAFTPPMNAGVVWGFFGAPFNNTTPNDSFNTPFVSGVGGTFSGTWNAPEGNNTTLADQLPNLFAGRAYINIHTVQFGGGEIRGALLAVPEPSTTALLGFGLAALAALARRRRAGSH